MLAALATAAALAGCSDPAPNDGCVRDQGGVFPEYGAPPPPCRDTGLADAGGDSASDADAKETGSETAADAGAGADATRD